MKNRSLLRLLTLLTALAAAGAAFYFLPVKETVKQILESFLAWVADLGAWGPVMLAVAYVPACLFFFPGSILTLGAGFTFGVVVGTVAVSLGSIAGASAAFFAGRTLLRGRIEERVNRDPRFTAIDRAVAEQAFKIVLLTRLSPVFPFNLLNYAFGLTRVRFRDYFLASWIGMLPGTVMYVYLGSAVQNLADLVSGKIEGGTGKKVLFFVGLAATVVVTVLVTRIAKKALAAAVPQNVSDPVLQGVAHD